MTASKKPHPSPDVLPLPSELVDTDCRHSNALAKALVDTIRSHYGAVSDFEIVGALEYVKDYAINGGFTWPGARAHQDDDEEGSTAS